MKAELILDAADLLVNPLVMHDKAYDVQSDSGHGSPPPGALISFILSTRLETEMIRGMAEAWQSLSILSKLCAMVLEAQGRLLRLRKVSAEPEARLDSERIIAHNGPIVYHTHLA